MTKTLLILIIGVIGYFTYINFVPKTKTLNPVSSVVQSPTVTPLPTPTPEQNRVILNVPFVSQAPTGKWSDPREQDGCEEATSYMAYLWATGEMPSKDLAEQEQKLLTISDWEEQTYGNYHDTDARDTVSRIINGYFKYYKAKTVDDINVNDIKKELSRGNLLIIPADGRALHNPFYTNGGPERHNLIIKGYDNKTDEFITNDNGTRHGESYRYNQEVLFNAIRDYPTGDHLAILEDKKIMIVVEK